MFSRRQLPGGYLMARVLKKQTRKAQRLARAKHKMVLASTLAIIQGSAGTISVQMVLGTKELNQLDLIMKWSDKCFKNIEIGKKAVLNACDRFVRVEKLLIEKRVPSRLVPIDQHIAVWVMISMLTDDCRIKAGGQREWNFLAGCVDTWTRLLMEKADNLGRAEEVGGELALEAWEIILK